MIQKYEMKLKNLKYVHCVLIQFLLGLFSENCVLH